MRIPPRSKHIVWVLTLLALSLLGRAPEHEWGVRAAHAQNNAAAEIEAASKRVVQLNVQGQHQAALALAAETLKRAQSVLGENHLNTVTSLNNYTFMLQALGRAAEVLPQYERALKLRAEMLGEKHPDTLTSLHNHAVVLETLGRAGEALPYYERALKLGTEMRGEKHPDTLNLLSHYATLLETLGHATVAHGWA